MLFVGGIAFGDNFCSHCGAPLKRVKEESMYRSCLPPPPCCESGYYRDYEYNFPPNDKECCKGDVKAKHCHKNKPKKDKCD